MRANKEFCVTKETFHISLMVKKINCPSKYYASVDIGEHLFIDIKKKNIGGKAWRASILGSRTRKIMREAAYKLLVRTMLRC